MQTAHLIVLLFAIIAACAVYFVYKSISAERAVKEVVDTVASRNLCRATTQTICDAVLNERINGNGSR